MVDIIAAIESDRTIKPLQAQATNERASTREIEWLGASKGVGIVLLVVLHVCAQSHAEMSPTITWFLRLFRMPMFFIVSGMLFSTRPPAVLLEKKLRSLIVPYISYLALISLLISLRAVVLGRENPLLSSKGLADLLLGGEYLKADFGVFWFMTCLLFTQLLYNMLLRAWGSPRSPYVIGAVAAIYCAGYAMWWTAPDVATPWAVGVVPFGLPFLWFGSLVKHVSISPRALRLTCGMTLLLALVLGYTGVHFEMDLKYAEPGAFFISIGLAIAVSWLFFESMKVAVKDPRLAGACELLGSASITIMFLHQFVHLSLRMIGIRSEFILIGAGVLLPLLFWVVARRLPLASTLFLGTAREIPFVSKRLIKV